MQSLKELYKIGRGPSSSHTLAPERACRLFMEKEGSFPFYEAELYGSLSLTGRGHETDRIIIETLDHPCEVTFHLDWVEGFPNGFYLYGLNENRERVRKWTVFSIGGGSILVKELGTVLEEVYEEDSFEQILAFVKREGISLSDYVYLHEPDLKDYLKEILNAMTDCVARGLPKEGRLPGKLGLSRSAKYIFQEAENDDRLRIMSYAYAACEENADHGVCVTAPTLGACGVLSALMYYLRNNCDIPDEILADALAVGGIFGNLIKKNATISGAVGGCQAEVGAAVSMAAAAYACVLGLTEEEIEYAAEIGMEHHLGLTCDPVMGYVMIPCIERNAVAVLRAMDAAELSRSLSRIRGHMISFDMVVKTMNETGKKIPIELKETSEGGLAKEYTSEEGRDDPAGRNTV